MAQRKLRRHADPETTAVPVPEVRPEVLRASVDPEPADVVRRSAALGGNAAALRTAQALGFAAGDLNADAFTGEEPPDFFFGTLASLDVPIPAPPQQDSPAAARAAVNLTVTGPGTEAVLGASGRTTGDGAATEAGTPAPDAASGAEVTTPPGPAGGATAPPSPPAGKPGTTPGTTGAPGTPGTRGAKPSPGTAGTGTPGALGASATASAAAPPATAVGPATVQTPDQLLTAVSTAAGKLTAAKASPGTPPDVAAGRAFPSALAAPLRAPAAVHSGGGGGVRRPAPDDDLPPDPVPKATKAVTTAAAAKLPELALPQPLSPPGGPAPKLVYPPQLAELKRPEPPKPEKPKKGKPKPTPAAATTEPPAPVPQPEPFVPPVLLDLRQLPIPKLDPKLRSAEQSKIRTVIASVKADLTTGAKPFVRQLRDTAGFGELLSAQYLRKEVAGFWEPVIGDKALMDRLLPPITAKVDELGEAAGLSASILDQAVKEKQQELIASGRAVSAQTKAQVAGRAQVVIGDAEKQAAQEQAKIAKEHAQRLKELRRAMTSHDPKLVNQLADERVTVIGDQVAGGILALENAATRRIDVIEALTATYLDAYRIADDAAQASARAAAKAADPGAPPSVVQVPRGPDGRPWLTWAREQVVTSMKALRTQTTTDRDTRITALREAGTAAAAAVREWAAKRIRHTLTQEEKQAQAVADRTTAEQRLEKARVQAAKDKARDDLVAQIRYAEAFHEARQAEAAGTTTDLQKKMLAEAGKDADAYLGAADVPGDPLSAVAHHLTEQVGGQVVAKLTETGVVAAEVKKLRATTFDQALSLGVVIFASRPPDATSRVASLSAATREKIGTDEDAVFAALDNLDGQQIDTISTLYQATYNEELYGRLDGELSGSEWDRAKALLKSDQVGATAAAIRYETNSWFSAPDRDKIAGYVRSLPPGKGDELEQRFGESARWYNSSSSGLKDVLGDTLRTYRYNPQTGESIPDDRGSEQIGLLLQVNMLKQPEPSPPAGAPRPRPSIIDAQERQNKIDALQAKADAIDLDLALRPAYGPAKADAMDDVFKRMRAEIADANPGWTAEQVNSEVRRRNANVEQAYGERFPAPLQVNNFGMPVQNLKPEDSRLRQVMAANLYASGEQEIGRAMLDVDRKAERTARILLADRGAYAADSDVNAGLEQSYLQAADEIKRAEGPRLRKERADRILKAQQEGKPLTKDQLAEEDRKLDRELERLTDKRARELMDETKVHWTKSGHGTLDDWVKDKTQWGGEKEAVWRLGQGGRLSRAQELKLAVDGWGIDMTQAKKALAGRTPDEIRQIAKDYKDLTGEDLLERLHSETSGENRFDIDEAMRGEPMTAQERMDALTRRYNYNKNTYFWGGKPPGQLSGSMRLLEAEYSYAQQAFAALKDPNAKLSVEDRNFLQRSFEAQATRTESRAEEYRAAVHAYTDEVVQIVSTAVAVIVGGALAIATGGAALPLIALAASLWATAATMVVKMALLGEAYGIHEYVDDLVVGAVDAAFAYATAGLGDKLLGVSKVTGADKAAIRLAATAARAQRAAKPLIARMGAALVENVAGAAPSALAGNLVNRDNWRGDMFMSVTKGTFAQMGTGMAVGSVIGHSLEMGGRVLGAVAGPALEKFRAARGGNAATEAAARTAGIAEHQHVPGTERVPKPVTDSTGAPVARIETEPSAVHQQQREMRREVLGDIPPRERAVFADTPITVLSDAEYTARTGSAERGMATVLIVNGKPEVVIREGAPLWALREEGRHLQQLRDPIHAEHLRLLDEARLRDWKNLPLHERMLSAQAHLELELAVQHEIIADLTHQKLVGSSDPHLQARLETAIRAEEALTARKHDLNSFRTAPEGSPTPAFLEEPPRLNTKKGTPRAAEIKLAEENAVKEAKGPPKPPPPPDETVAGETAAEKPPPKPKRKRGAKQAEEVPERPPLSAEEQAKADAEAEAAKAAAEARAAAEAAAQERMKGWREDLARNQERLETLNKQIADLKNARVELAEISKQESASRDPEATRKRARRRKEILKQISESVFEDEDALNLHNYEYEMRKALEGLEGAKGERQTVKDRIAELTKRLDPNNLDPRLARAGAYKDIEAQTGERHHMPANEALSQARDILLRMGDERYKSPLLTEGDGGVIQMVKEDHYETGSHGGGDPSSAPAKYRDEQVKLIVDGKYLEAVLKDLEDIRQNHDMASKYESVIQHFLDYLEENRSEVNKLNQNSDVDINTLRDPVRSAAAAKALAVTRAAAGAAGVP